MPYRNDSNEDDETTNNNDNQSRSNEVIINPTILKGILKNSITTIENEEVEAFLFSNRSIRMSFIRKVYAILMCQLLITFGIIFIAMYYEPVGNVIRKYPNLLWVAVTIMGITFIAMVCSTKLRRKVPMNYIFLGIFTLAEAFIFSMISLLFQKQEVLLAVGITAAVCLGLTLFAFQTRWDFTKLSGCLAVGLVIFIVFGVLSLLYTERILSILYASIGAFLFSIYLIFDTQLMMGDKKEHALSPEEYVYAALNLYLDVVNIFIFVLTVILSRGED